MKRRKKLLIIFFVAIGPIYLGYCFLYSTIFSKKFSVTPGNNFEIGDKVDSLNNVYVYYNGRIGHTGDRNVSEDGYNIGLTYQCVEFVKRYYYEYYDHKMPDPYGNAKDFFDSAIADGKLNGKRNLMQFTNPSKSKPKTGDLIIFDGHAGNAYGHVAIISKVDDDEIEIIQQNPGPSGPSRAKFSLSRDEGKFKVGHERALGWLRMK